MANPLAALAALSGKMGPGSSPMMSVPKGRKMGSGSVPDQAPMMNKAKALLGGVPMSMKGRKPRLGGL